MPRLIEEELPKIMFQTAALKFGMFTLSVGKLSPYYLDLRVLPSFPDAFHASIELLGKTAGTIADIAKIAGIPTGGLPWASVLAYTLSKPLVYVSKEVKHRDREKVVESLLVHDHQVRL